MAKPSVTKPRGYPDRRGMGAQSDFIAEQFIPSEQYIAQQMAMAQKLAVMGVVRNRLKRCSSCQLTCSPVKSQKTRSQKIASILCLKIRDIIAAHSMIVGPIETADPSAPLRSGRMTNLCQ
jgi:hypothetical protein